MTPAEKCGIKIEGEYEWKTIIENARFKSISILEEFHRKYSKILNTMKTNINRPEMPAKPKGTRK